MMLLCVSAATAFSPLSVGPSVVPHSLRAAAPVMVTRKVYAFDNEGVFEAREVGIAREPVYLLSAVENLGVATAVSDLGLLSAAEEAGVFSTLEKFGAFSLAEKLLPVIEDLKLLTTFEKLLDVEFALQFSVAGFILVTGPILFTLQICGFVPFPSGPAVAAEVAFDAVTLTLGLAGVVTALIIGKLQETTE